VRGLLEAEANPVVPDEAGRTAMMLAIHAQAAGLAVAQTFLRKQEPWFAKVKNEINHTDGDGESALMMAVNLNQENVAALLLDADADVNQRDGSGALPLTNAKKEGMIKVLCSKEPTLKVKDGCSVLSQLLLAKNGQSLANALHDCIPLERLVEAGEASTSVEEMEILLHWTAEGTRLRTEAEKEELFGKIVGGVPPETISAILVSTTARDSSYASVVKFLLRKGARGEDAIEQAIRRKRVAVVSELLCLADLSAESDANKGLDMLENVGVKAKQALKEMEADVSAKQLFMVLGKVVYGIKQWEDIETKISRANNATAAIEEYKKRVLKGLTDVLQKKEEREREKERKMKEVLEAKRRKEKEALEKELKELEEQARRGRFAEAQDALDSDFEGDFDSDEDMDSDFGAFDMAQHNSSEMRPTDTEAATETVAATGTEASRE